MPLKSRDGVPSGLQEPLQRPDCAEIIRIKNSAVSSLASALTQSALSGRSSPEDAASDAKISAAIDGAAPAPGILTPQARTDLIKSIRDELFGYGPIEDLIRDSGVSEIMVNAPDEIYAERSGLLQFCPGLAFDSEEHVKRIIDRIVSPLGRHIDEANPMVDARLPDGSRVNAVIPPIALKGPALTIRKFSSAPMTVESLIALGSLSRDMADFLGAAVAGRMNILISGGTGSGKTTLLNVLSSFIPDKERIITIEDAAELKLMQRHVVRLESRPPGIGGTGAVTVRDMVKNSLRMRPDRIIVGEVRGEECLDMLQAMNTGHDGSMTTAHANSPRDALSRVETMALMSGMDLPLNAVRQQCASAFDLIIHQSRFPDGSRKITSISEVTGMNGDTVTLQELFRYEKDAYPKSRFSACGIVPACCAKIESSGAGVMRSWFEPAGIPG